MLAGNLTGKPETGHRASISGRRRRDLGFLIRRTTNPDQESLFTNHAHIYRGARERERERIGEVLFSVN
ncbi:hypothetical protein Syun_011642 [Stephania yunnanensis]|uniref:Uncharacterized protein n=1 Tax=Stephania yunnanensis TaxID=152371 RepID=A0AAP0JXX5_9MAGN